jgi:hypothetical protein
MWLLVLGAIVLVIVIAMFGEAFGYDMTAKPSPSMQEYVLDADYFFGAIIAIMIIASQPPFPIHAISLV